MELNENFIPLETEGEPLTTSQATDLQSQTALVSATPLHASLRLLRILDRLRAANQEDDAPEEQRQQKRLKQLEIEGVESNWWTQEELDRQKGSLMFDSSDDAAEDSEEAGDMVLPAVPTPVTNRKRATPTKDTVVKTLPFDQLLPRQDQCWLNPYRSTKYRMLLVHSPLTTFTGEPKQDKVTVAQWARVTAVTLFKDVGAPLEEAVRLVGRCFPDACRARLWYTKYTATYPDSTYAEFMHAFVPAFTDPEQARKNRADLFSLRQNTLPFSTFTYQHAVLWHLVNPNSSEGDMVRNWELRLNSQCTPVFQKYLTKVARDNRNPTYNHAVEHMDEKVSQRERATETVFTIVNTTSSGHKGPKMVECGRGCRRRRHAEGEECPAASRKCNECGVVGHFRTSKMCEKKQEKDKQANMVALVKPAKPAAVVAATVSDDDVD